MAKAAKTQFIIRSVEQTENLSASQALAKRIYYGQSPDLPISERVSRIVNALKDKGFDLDITLPHSDAERFINAAKTD
jgi:hypothetical protein